MGTSSAYHTTEPFLPFLRALSLPRKQTRFVPFSPFSWVIRFFFSIIYAFVSHDFFFCRPSRQLYECDPRVFFFLFFVAIRSASPIPGPELAVLLPLMWSTLARFSFSRAHGVYPAVRTTAFPGYPPLRCIFRRTHRSQGFFLRLFFYFEIRSGHSALCRALGHSVGLPVLIILRKRLHPF